MSDQRPHGEAHEEDPPADLEAVITDPGVDRGTERTRAAGHSVRIGHHAETPVGRGREREEIIRALHEQGATLEQMGDAVGVTRERARQLCAALGLSSGGRGERRVAWTTAQHGARIRERFLDSRDDQAIADELELPVSVVRGVVDGLVPDAGLLRRRKTASVPRYADPELIDLLRAAAAELGSPLPHQRYKTWATGRHLNDGRTAPGPQTMTLRWGSWRAALRRAGLEVGPRLGPTSEASRVQIVAAVVNCWHDVGRPPTVADFDTWRTDGGREVPSVATARKFIDGWLDAQLSAWEVIHGLKLVRSDLPELDDVEPDPEDPLALPDPNWPTGSADGIRDGEAQRSPSNGDVYRPADESVEVAQGEEIVISAAAQQRARRAHARMQNEVARQIAAAGGQALSPATSIFQYDIAWRRADNALVLCEVKSAEADTLEAQLRAAVGQILRYGAQARALGVAALALAIYVELPPDAIWQRLAADLQITLVWPETLGALTGTEDHLTVLAAPTHFPGEA